jgi:hypothetical protein
MKGVVYFMEKELVKNQLVIPYKKSVGSAWDHSDAKKRIEKRIRCVFGIVEVRDDNRYGGFKYILEYVHEHYKSHDLITLDEDEAHRIYYEGHISDDTLHYYIHQIRRYKKE